MIKFSKIVINVLNDKMHGQMKRGKKMKTHTHIRNSAAFITIAIMLIASIVVFGLQSTPYHSQSTGVKIKNYSQFTGDTPGQGEYKATKGKYIKKAWVSIKEGDYYQKKYSSIATSKTDSKVRSVTLTKANNPIKPQTLDYNWVYR
jgi:hypothetical protein